MAAPNSNGVLRTKLSDMKIGDYIKWQYNDGKDYITPGTFSDTISLGEMALGTEVSDFCNGASLVPKSGFFYFIKVAPGMVIADRRVKIISKAMLNASNMLKGNTYRCLTVDEYKKYLIYSDLNSTIKPNDTTVFHHNNQIIEQLQTGVWMGVDGYGELASAFTANAVWTYTRKNEPMLTASIDQYNRYLAYRPVMEYVDNKKSTNIYY